MPRRLEGALSSTWLVVAIVGVGTIACKAAGPIVLGGRSLPPQLAGIVDMLAPALLAALVGGTIAFALVPFTAPGVPIIAATAGCLVGWRKR